MPQYVLTADHTRAGLTFVRGTVLSTDAPERSVYHISPKEAESLEADGLLQPYNPVLVTGARDREAGWRQTARRERGDSSNDRVPWG